MQHGLSYADYDGCPSVVGIYDTLELAQKAAQDELNEREAEIPEEDRDNTILDWDQISEGYWTAQDGDGLFAINTMGEVYAAI